jgi:hypothetical protein
MSTATSISNSVLGHDDLLFYKEQHGGNDIIMSGGYSVDSFLLKNGLSPMQTFGALEGGNKQSEGKKQVSSVFENLAVPAGLFYINQKPTQDAYSKSKQKSMEHKMLPDNIFDEFIKIIEIDKHRKRQRKTRRQEDIPNKRTRKQRVLNK